MFVEWVAECQWNHWQHGRGIRSIPLAWFPRLLHAKPDQLQKFELSFAGIHWEELDEDISVEGFWLGVEM